MKSKSLKSHANVTAHIVWPRGEVILSGIQGYISCKLHSVQLGFVPLVVNGRNDLHMASNLRSG